MKTHPQNKWIEMSTYKIYVRTLTGSNFSKNAFSLVELLTVIAIISLLTALSGPAISALIGAGTVDKAIFDLSGTLQSARAHAMARHTYVRVAIAETTSVSSRMVILSLYSSDGTLSAGSGAPSASDMGNPTLWPAMTKPLNLEGIKIFDAINASSPATGSDARPSDSPITFGRTVGGASLTFKWIIQFTPAGEATVLKSLSDVPTPDRYIKIAMDRPSPAAPSSPISATASSPQAQFILRISGVNGSVAILRKGEGI